MKKLIVMLLMLAPMTVFAQKFGHINTEELITSLPDFIKARAEVEAKAKEFENELRGMQEELQRKAEEYEKSKSTMNASKQKETEEMLMGLQQKIQETYQQSQQQLQQVQQQAMEPLQTKVFNAIKAVGEAGGYVYIMDTAMGIPFINQTLSKDVTADVRAELNKLK